jgi:hypothetical protein
MHTLRILATFCEQIDILRNIREMHDAEFELCFSSLYGFFETSGRN